jgi:hypothetical protein
MVYAFLVKCPNCSHQWVSERPLNLEDMVEIYSREQAHQIKDIPTLIEIFHGHRRRSFQGAMPPPWPIHNFFEHTGRTAKAAWCLGSIFGRQPTWEQQQAFLEYLHRSARRIGKRGDWIVREYEKEFGPGTWEQMARLMSPTGGDRSQRP